MFVNVKVIYAFVRRRFVYISLWTCLFYFIYLITCASAIICLTSARYLQRSSVPNYWTCPCVNFMWDASLDKERTWKRHTRLKTIFSISHFPLITEIIFPFMRTCLATWHIWPIRTEEKKLTMADDVMMKEPCVSIGWS